MPRFVLVIYRMPTKPTAGRVAVWRQLKKMGAVYLQQSVCVFPDTNVTRRELQPILERIQQSRGEYHLLSLRALPPSEQDKLVAQFRSQTSRQYEEIIENCEVNFQKEIEFETFRRNFTYEEAEEERIEFDKICMWFDQVAARDWFNAPHQDEARSWVERCRQLLEEFEAKVFQVQEHGVEANQQPARPSRRRARSVRLPPHVQTAPPANGRRAREQSLTSGASPAEHPREGAGRGRAPQ